MFPALIVDSSKYLHKHTRHETFSYTCTIGRSGMIGASDKREGDGATPIGKWPMRRIYYRADRITLPKLSLPSIAITKDMGWCDAPADPAYNQRLTLPYAASHEVLWREDHAYDLIVELGHNDSPPVPGLGSAVFMHVAKPGYTPTEGCVALALEDLIAVLTDCSAGTLLDIRA